MINELNPLFEFIVAILWAFDSLCFELVLSPMLTAGPLFRETTAQRQMIYFLQTVGVPGQLAHSGEVFQFRCRCSGEPFCIFGEQKVTFISWIHRQ